MVLVFQVEGLVEVITTAQINRVLAANYRPAYVAERERLLKGGSVMDGFIPGWSEWQVAELDGLIALCDRILGEETS